MSAVSTHPTVSSAEETRERIAQAAIRLFAGHGFDGTSVREIAEAAGVTKPVLYYHFGSKDQLYVAAIELCYSRFRKYLKEVVPTTGPFRDRLRTVVKVHFDYFVREQAIARMLYSVAFAPQRNSPNVDFAQLEEPHLYMLAGLIQDGIHAGEVRNLPAEEAALLLLGMMNIHLEAFIITGETPGEKESERVVSVFTDGVIQR